MKNRVIISTPIELREFLMNPQVINDPSYYFDYDQIRAMSEYKTLLLTVWGDFEDAFTRPFWGGDKVKPFYPTRSFIKDYALNADFSTDLDRLAKAFGVSA